VTSKAPSDCSWIPRAVSTSAIRSGDTVTHSPAAARLNRLASESSRHVLAARRRLEEAGFAAGTLPVGQGGGPPAAALAAWVEALGLL
jgi:hypothetical protein